MNKLLKFILYFSDVVHTSKYYTTFPIVLDNFMVVVLPIIFELNTLNCTPCFYYMTFLV